MNVFHRKMFNFLNNTPSTEKQEKKPKKEKFFDNFSKSKQEKEEDLNIEGFSMMNNGLNVSEFMTNKMETFDLESTKEPIKGGLESLMALLPKQKEGMTNLKKKTENMENYLKKKEGMHHEKKEGMHHEKKEGMKNKKESMKNKKESMKNKKESMKNKKEGMTGIMEFKKKEKEGDLDNIDDLEQELEGMATMKMDRNSQVFAGGLTIIALLLVFKFMQSKK